MCAKHQSDLKPNYLLEEKKHYCFPVNGAIICLLGIINLQMIKASNMHLTVSKGLGVSGGGRDVNKVQI